eukprot:GEMP01064948.1.p1 GENE.GEMP01064948.1~~GEMP01064948.1.p1  ORF type:complete len:188 (+),score=30.03 GEMP01064948.1:35-598(+)
MKPLGWVFGGASKTRTTTPNTHQVSNQQVPADASTSVDVLKPAIVDSDVELWSEGLINPLDIRFSQKSVHPCFENRGAIEDGVDQIRHRTLENGVQLMPPFPMIRVLEATPGHYVDNRRLYCLQRAAVKLYPSACFTYCLITPALPRYRRKTEFRKFTAGKLGDMKVTVESKHGVHCAWNWKDALVS